MTNRDVDTELEELLQPILRDKGRVDFATRALGATFAPPDGLGLRLRRLPLWSSWAVSRAVEVGAGGVELSGELGWAQLERLAQSLEQQLHQVADRQSPITWFTLRKRLPTSSLAAALPSTADTLLQVAWEGAASATGVGLLLPFMLAPWRITPRVLTDLDDLLCLALILRNVRVAARRVSKGQSLILGNGTLAPQGISGPDAVERAIELYDSRLALSGRGVAHDLGTLLTSATDRITSSTIITWADLREQDLFPRKLVADLLRVRDPFFPLATDLANFVPAALKQVGGVTFDTQAVVLALQAGWGWLARRRATFRNRRGSWTQYGYLRCPQRWVMSQLSQGPPVKELLGQVWLSGADGSKVLGRLEEMSIVHPVSRWFLIDLALASASLPDTLRRAQQGTDANLWGVDFEYQVQSLIDDSPWRPPDPFRSLIGKTVRAGRNAITDLDCIALSGKTLLLISCKALQVTPAAARGEYAATHTMRRKIEAASVDWHSKLARIRDHPEMLDVRIPCDTFIEGIVVVPFVPYVLPGSATTVVGDLLHVSSIDELAIAAFKDDKVYQA